MIDLHGPARCSTCAGWTIVVDHLGLCGCLSLLLGIRLCLNRRHDRWSVPVSALSLVDMFLFCSGKHCVDQEIEDHYIYNRGFWKRNAEAYTSGCVSPYGETANYSAYVLLSSEVAAVFEMYCHLIHECRPESSPEIGKRLAE